MFKNIPLNILMFSILAFFITLSIESPPNPQAIPQFPWLIGQSEQGHTQVLGITLQETRLKEIQNTFASEGKVTLFLSPEGHYSLEVYFEGLYLSGLKADIILSLNTNKKDADQMFQSGARISMLGNGTQKISLSAKDLDRIEQKTAYLLTYLPKMHLEPDLILQRFGQPKEKITEDNEAVHWLYPLKGIDITYHHEKKEVIQYISPKDYPQLVKPLEPFRKNH